jgi:hypothetical protein
LYVLVELGTQKSGNTTPWFPVYYIFPHIRKNLPHDGRCSSRREIPSSNVEGVFLADGTAKALRCFCTYHQKHFLISKMRVPDWEFFGTGQKCHPT